MSLTGRALAESWLAAATQAAVQAELELVYERTQAAIEARGPACWASGRCCNFEATGHRLYVTGLETAYAVVKGAAATEVEIAAARGGDGCPFQRENLCGIHAIKPLGCRVYFCDRTSHAWQHEVYEEQFNAVRKMHERWAVEYRYGEWRDMLEVFAAAGRST